MSARLQSVLQDLKDRYGATASDLTADELEALVFACKRCDSPFSELNAEMIERPVYVARGIWLWPLTAGAAVWLTEYASAWWKSSSAMYRFAQVYALVHGRDKDAFAPLTTKSLARAAILRCILRFGVHTAELTDAMDRAYGIDRYHVSPERKSPQAQKAETDFAAIVARLEVASGIPADSWIWGRSLVSMMKSYGELSELATAAMGGTRTKMHDELDEAVENLARICSKIGRRLKQCQTA